MSKTELQAKISLLHDLFAKTQEQAMIAHRFFEALLGPEAWRGRDFCLKVPQADRLFAEKTERIAHLEEKMERNLIAVAHFTHRYNEDLATIAQLRSALKRFVQAAPLGGDLRLLMISLSAFGLKPEDEAYAVEYETALDEARAALAKIDTVK